jgi:hypothetical protein
MAKSDVVRLLVRLLGDPKLAERLQKDPDGVLARARLSAKERALLAGRDPDAIRAYLGREGARANIKTSAELPNIKTKAALANIKTKAALANIKSKFRK